MFVFSWYSLITLFLHLFVYERNLIYEVFYARKYRKSLFTHVTPANVTSVNEQLINDVIMDFKAERTQLTSIKDVYLALLYNIQLIQGRGYMQAHFVTSLNKVYSAEPITANMQMFRGWRRPCGGVSNLHIMHIHVHRCCLPTLMSLCSTGEVWKHDF